MGKMGLKSKPIQDAASADSNAVHSLADQIINDVRLQYDLLGGGNFFQGITIEIQGGHLKPICARTLKPDHSLELFEQPGVLANVQDALHTFSRGFTLKTGWFFL